MLANSTGVAYCPVAEGEVGKGLLMAIPPRASFSKEAGTVSFNHKGKAGGASSVA